MLYIECKIKSYWISKMSMHFFLNYGGPGGQWASDDLNKTNQLDSICRNTYVIPIRKVQFNVKGIDVTICTYGVHRALRLDVPEGASRETIDAFEKAKKAGLHIIRTKYVLLDNNCVTAVAKVLNNLDSRMTSEDVIWPWNLDENVKKYGNYYPENTVANSFMIKYTEIADREFFSYMRTRHWTEKTITSNQDIIAHAYGKTGGTGERTKSTLIELGWVTEDEKHILRPTNKAPIEFKAGLKTFNRDYEKMLHLKNLYKNEASFFSRNTRDFFKDNPNYETALQRVKQQAIKNPTGASAKVITVLNKEQLKDKGIDGLSPR